MTYQLIPKATADGIPLFTMGYGRTSAENGAIFRNVFNFPVNYWDGASVIVNDIIKNNNGDVKGKKIRVMKSQTAVKMIDAFGGGATPISWGELYTALQQGVVDGAENNPPSLYLSRQYEVCKYYILDEHTSVPDILLMSLHIWDNLNPEQQGWLQQAVDDSTVFQSVLWEKASNEALAAIEASGVEIIRPDKAPFMAAVEDMKAEYKGTAIGDVLDAIEAQ